MPPSKYTVDDIEKIYKKYRETVNMTHSELKKWAANPCSHKASLDRSPITRNLRLLSTPKKQWTPEDAKDANRTISFISRMRGMRSGRFVSKKCPYSKRNISLRNWAYNPNKKNWGYNPNK
jgi:hypothetical protein